MLFFIFKRSVQFLHWWLSSKKKKLYFTSTIKTRDGTLKGHYDWVLLNVEIAILIVTILWFFYCVLYTIKLYSVSNWCIHSLKHYFSAMKWDRNTICTVFYSLNFLKPIHVKNVHLLPYYSPNNDIEQNNIPSELLLMEYHWWHVQSDLSVPTVFVVLWHTLCS